MASLTPPVALSSATPSLPASRNIPTDFRSSLSAWWSTSSFKETRIAEERLLRRLAMYEPAPAPATAPPLPATAAVGVHEQGGAKSWFGFTRGSSGSTISLPNQISAAQDKEPQSQSQQQVSSNSASAASSSGLVATLRNVFITTPNPADAPAHPADPRDLPPPSGHGPQHEEKKSHRHISRHCKNDESKLKDYINTLEISTPANKDSKEAVVVLHGYAAALGFFFQNWESIATSSAATSRRTFFLDWLGMGLSSRPSPSLLSSPSNAPIPSRVARAEHFFLASLENWRQSVGLEKMVLVGHSLGGYLASAYAVRYPERVSGLVLVSPAGIPHGPEYVRYPLTAEQPSQTQTQTQTQAEAERLRREGSETSQELEGAVDAAEMELGTGPAGGGGAKEGAKGEAKEWEKRRQESVVRRGMMKFFVWGWERGLSPFSILRTAGPFGPLWVGKYSSRRFAKQTEEDVRDLHAYIYGTSVMKGSGEYCISHILAPGAYARIPILDRIDRLKVPVTFMYGDNDWMDVQGGHDSAAALAKAGNNNCSVHVVPDAGHHLYLDNPEVSNKLLDEAIRAVPKDL
ncbi:cardiolipin-specific phospholipase [Cryptococcus deuterogattii LA55]|nr:cardiolipin-specific phospholipase [Cryptococcus deuterogattii LA55]KIR93441.1 cardiolipin-specific phospholipase [Cryptococcus deuterogattii CBS 10090]